MTGWRQTEQWLHNHVVVIDVYATVLENAGSQLKCEVTTCMRWYTHSSTVQLNQHENNGCNTTAAAGSDSEHTHMTRDPLAMSHGALTQCHT